MYDSPGTLQARAVLERKTGCAFACPKVHSVELSTGYTHDLRIFLSALFLAASAFFLRLTDGFS
jgi:hypothetical protein